MRVLIVSSDKDFSQPLAEQVKAQLGMDCQIAENNEQAKALASSAQLVVTSDAAGKISGPVIMIKKPIRMGVLLSEIESRLQKSVDDNIAIGRTYALSARQKKLQHTTSGKVIEVTDKEAQLLRSLAKAGKKGIAKEQLLKEVWGFDEALNTHTLETHIYRLRGKFKELAGDDSIITATDGGYGLK